MHCYRKLIALGALLFSAASWGQSCPATSSNGHITLNVSQPRSSAISPFLAFFDATGSTDTTVTGNASVFEQDVFTWNYNDTSPVSGAGIWPFGSGSAWNGKNISTGADGAHMYYTDGSGNENFQSTVTMTNPSGDTVSCVVGGTVLDPEGADGFPGTATTCVAASTTPVAGAGGCPAAAAVLQSSTISGAWNGSTSNHRYLFHCGDSFSGHINVAAGVSTVTIGAYGSPNCSNTLTARPIFTGSSGNPTFENIAPNNDIRIIDIDFEGGSFAWNTGAGVLSATGILFYNNNVGVVASGMMGAWHTGEFSQSGIIQSVQQGMPSPASAASEDTFWNFQENNCTNGSAAFNCGGGSGQPVYNNVQYNAFIGNDFDGTGATSGNTWENFRISACRMCIWDNNTINISYQGGSKLKIHSGNTFGSNEVWIGQYSEYLVITGNLMQGTGGSVMDIAPQNQTTDERIRFVVVERNIFNTNGVDFSGQNMTVRNNASNEGAIQLYQRGTMSGCPGCYGNDPSGIAWPTQFISAYNNSCAGSCVNISESGIIAGGAAAANSIARNNLCFGGTCVSNSGTGNTVSNNSSSTTLNPDWLNFSGTMNKITDWKHTANFSGGISAPNLFDALGVPQTSPPDLGAVHH